MFLFTHNSPYVREYKTISGSLAVLYGTQTKGRIVSDTHWCLSWDARSTFVVIWGVQTTASRHFVMVLNNNVLPRSTITADFLAFPSSSRSRDFCWCPPFAFLTDSWTNPSALRLAAIAAVFHSAMPIKETNVERGTKRINPKYVFDCSSNETSKPLSP